MQDDRTKTIEGCLAGLVRAIGEVSLAGRIATGYNGRIDVKQAFAIFDALHNVGGIHARAERGDVADALGTLSHIRDAFASMPSDLRGRDRMIEALEAYRDALSPTPAATQGDAFPSGFLR